MTTFIMIRHGESEANHQNFFAGQLDADLHENGLRQARLTAKYIVDNYKVDKVYASDLKRAYKTAQCLADELGCEVIPKKALREISAGAWEGVHFSELQERYAEEYGIWINHIGRAQCVGGESVKQLGDRIMGALTEIAEENDGKTVAIATHATPIRVSQCLIQCDTLDEMENVPWVSNASVTVYEYNNGEWRVVSVSEDKHLADAKTVFPANV